MTRVPAVSFEMFPPPKLDGVDKFVAAYRALAEAHPTTVSVTYGAGGSGRERSVAAISKLSELQGQVPKFAPLTAHLTRIDADKTEIDAVADSLWRVGVRRILALGGDAPVQKDVRPTEEYKTATDLIMGLRTLYDFEIGCAAFPEGRPNGETAEDDLKILAAKEAAGAQFAWTQFFFDDDAFLRYRDQAAARSLKIKVIPGLMPVANFDGLRSFAARCGAPLPNWLVNDFERCGQDQAARRETALEIAVRQVETWRRNGVEDIHLYTLNQTDLPLAILREIGYAPDSAGTLCAA